MTESDVTVNPNHAFRWEEFPHAQQALSLAVCIDEALSRAIRQAHEELFQATHGFPPS